MTAGSGDAAGCAGFESVPASVNPLAGIRTCSSFGREIGTRRAATDAMSSRTTSIDCAGRLSRSIRAASSVHMSASSGVPGSTSVRCVRLRLEQTRRGLDPIVSRLAGTDRERRSANELRRDAGARAARFQPHRDRFIRRKEAVRHDQHGVRIDRVAFLRSLAGYRDVAGRRRAIDDGVNVLRLAFDGAVERELERSPVRRIAHLHASADDVERRAEAARARRSSSRPRFVHTEICSVPSGAPRTKIVKLEEPAAAVPGRRRLLLRSERLAAIAIATATPHPRIKWLERMSQHNTAIPGVSSRGYDAARRHAAFFERAKSRADRRFRARPRARICTGCSRTTSRRSPLVRDGTPPISHRRAA